MSFNFGAPNPAGVTVNQPMSKDLRVSATKLTNADFSTGGTASVKLALPADASIVSIRYWVKTAFAGGGVSAITVALGTPASPTTFVPGQSVTNSIGSYNVIGATNIMQDYNVPWGLDIQLQVTGTSTGGNPTSGEMYIIVEWIR